MLRENVNAVSASLVLVELIRQAPELSAVSSLVVVVLNEPSPSRGYPLGSESL